MIQETRIETLMTTEKAAKQFTSPSMIQENKDRNATHKMDPDIKFIQSPSMIQENKDSKRTYANQSTGEEESPSMIQENKRSKPWKTPAEIRRTRCRPA